MILIGDGIVHIMHAPLGVFDRVLVLCLNSESCMRLRSDRVMIQLRTVIILARIMWDAPPAHPSYRVLA